MLFSEPKIPQLQARPLRKTTHRCFSALQRAENSSMKIHEPRVAGLFHKFQCSSASRKFLNLTRPVRPSNHTQVSVLFSEPKIPQSGSHTRSGARA